MDNIDIKTARELGVTALNVPDYGSAEVADHAMTLLLCLLRGVPAWSGSTAQGSWPVRGELPDPLELRECTLGVLGFGAIAREVVARARAFGMPVLAHDPFVPDEDVTNAGAEPVGIEDLWRRSTAVSVHAPLTAATRGIVNTAALSLMQPGSFLINTARAGLVDRGALQGALDGGQLAGVGLDVWWQEPAEADDSLVRARTLPAARSTHSSTFGRYSSISCGRAAARSDNAPASRAATYRATVWWETPRQLPGITQRPGQVERFQHVHDLLGRLPRCPSWGRRAHQHRQPHPRRGLNRRKRRGERRRVGQIS